jgi:hypothetical protein
MASTPRRVQRPRDSGSGARLAPGGDGHDPQRNPSGRNHPGYEPSPTRVLRDGSFEMDGGRIADLARMGVKK